VLGHLGSRKTLEDVAFLSGAALATLYIVLSSAELPHSLQRDRLALQAAEACVQYSGRFEWAGDIRDAVHFLCLGDQLGPAGDIYLHWRRAVERPISIGALEKALPQITGDQMAIWLGVGQGVATAAIGAASAMARISALSETVLHEFPREEAAALFLEDAALAQALG